ncbi:hypothetical protein EDC01DRAFT_791269 [Geopyxis carbonaria]|nr:hypothetical protein EDC01DRAFT_791269 [Geopyxis carbonaria]
MVNKSVNKLPAAPIRPPPDLAIHPPSLAVPQKLQFQSSDRLDKWKSEGRFISLPGKPEEVTGREHVDEVHKEVKENNIPADFSKILEQFPLPPTGPRKQVAEARDEVSDATTALQQKDVAEDDSSVAPNSELRIPSPKENDSIIPEVKSVQEGFEDNSSIKPKVTSVKEVVEYIESMKTSKPDSQNYTPVKSSEKSSIKVDASSSANEAKQSSRPTWPPAPTGSEEMEPRNPATVSSDELPTSDPFYPPEPTVSEVLEPGNAATASPDNMPQGSPEPTSAMNPSGTSTSVPLNPDSMRWVCPELEPKPFSADPETMRWVCPGAEPKPFKPSRHQKIDPDYDRSFYTPEELRLLNGLINNEQPHDYSEIDFQDQIMRPPRVQNPKHPSAVLWDLNYPMYTREGTFARPKIIKPPGFRRTNNPLSEPAIRYKYDTNPEWGKGFKAPKPVAQQDNPEGLADWAANLPGFRETGEPEEQELPVSKEELEKVVDAMAGPMAHRLENSQCWALPRGWGIFGSGAAGSKSTPGQLPDMDLLKVEVPPVPMSKKDIKREKMIKKLERNREEKQRKEEKKREKAEKKREKAEKKQGKRHWKNFLKPAKEEDKGDSKEKEIETLGSGAVIQGSKDALVSRKVFGFGSLFK